MFPQGALVAVRRQVLDEEAGRAFSAHVARLSAAPWVRPAVLALGVTDDSLFGELLERFLRDLVTRGCVYARGSNCGWLA